MDPRAAFSAAVTTGGVLGLVLAGLNLPTPLVSAPAPLPRPVSLEATTWDLPVARNQFVQRFVDLFHKQQQDRMALYLKRSGRYEGMIRTKLRERGMPEDLLYLSMIESGFNPNARSKAAAVGLWQFVPETARDYGLRIDEYVDERRHPEKSTDAALRYLDDLYEQFGSWSLAAAAYNSGANRVARIMMEVTGAVKGTERDFWRIRARLPAETREYVPLVFAAALVGKEPQKYGLGWVERLLPIELEKVDVPGGTPLDRVSAAIGVEPQVLRELNPHLVRGMTPPGDPYPVSIPAGRRTLFARNFPAPSAEPAAAAAAGQPVTHRVASGESLASIAHQHGTTVSALQRANNLGSGTVIRIGQLLRIPA